MTERSVCQQKGKGSLAHNNRDFVSKNVDENRIKDNVILKQQSLQDAYDECFGQAVKDYNMKQKRKDRQIDDYFQSVFGVSAKSAAANSVLQSKDKTKSFYEDIVQIGDMHDTGIKSNPKAAELAKQALIEYANGFEARNPRFHVFNAVIHMDEATPHLHIDYIPIAVGYKRGLQVQNGYNKALEQMGYVGKYVNEEYVSGFDQWREHERDVFREICKRYGLDPKPKELEENRGHTYTPKEYRQLMREAEQTKDKAEQEIQSAYRMSHKASEKLSKLQNKETELQAREMKLQKQAEALQAREANMQAEILQRVEERLKIQREAESLDNTQSCPSKYREIPDY